ncbi:replication initiation protein RepC [Shinella sp. CPCC 100929]|uniref:Replication initiation protein RepC n=1 Tax=Shinella lacus TaxID=2654216 RepID=A0ABT1QZQ6_9HYPH|nr:plasmid replication protein RepC [Shinella lacus]MCQ4628404.1 replication initiation protein RepC [Shinella lacus]
MQSGNVTTPFGRRPISLALVRQQVATAEIPAGKRADKWKVFRDASEARVLLGLQDRSLAVLDALLSFYPENELRQDAQLVVFPSNAQLSIRAHGMAGATLRRHLAFLVESGLVIRKDSANGKRYARKDRSGTIESAFGFDISPLLLRAEELAEMAQKVAAERAAFRRAKEELTIRRRDVRKLISAAIEEGAPGDWAAIEDIYISLISQISRAPTMADAIKISAELTLLQEKVVNMLENFDNSKKTSSNAAQSGQHIQNSKTESIRELEPSSETELGAIPSKNLKPNAQPPLPFPLGLVLKACQEISAYGPAGTIGNWRDMMSAAIVARSMLGISPSAYEEACEVMGSENAAVTLACILERAGHINSPGGYLRNLTSRARRGEFSLGPVLMALLRSGGEGAREAG